MKKYPSTSALLIAAWLISGCAYDAHPPSSGTATEMLPEHIDSAATVAEVPEEEIATPAASATDEEPAADPPPAAADPAPFRHVPLDPVIAATYAAWNARATEDRDIRAMGERCETYLEGIEIITADHDTFRELCFACDASDPDPSCVERGRAHACSPWARSRRGEARRALVVVEAAAAATPTRTSLIIHETIHHLGWCTGLGTDSLHQLEALWCEGPSAACRRSVHSRAERLVTDR